MTRIDDLTTHVLAIGDLQASVVSINQRLEQAHRNTANVMQGIEAILAKMNATSSTSTTTFFLPAVREENNPSSPSTTQSNSSSFTPPIDLLDLNSALPPAPSPTAPTAFTNAPQIPRASPNTPTTTTAFTNAPPLPPASTTTAIPSANPSIPSAIAPSLPPSSVQPAPHPVPPTPPFSNATHQSFTPTPVQQPPPNMINQATIPFLFNQQQQQPNGQTVIVQQQSNQQRKFDKFKPQKGDTYTYWKTSSFSQLHTDMDPFYKTMITFDPATTALDLNLTMSPQQNSRLYFMTTKALGQLAQKFISQADQHRWPTQHYNRRAFR